MGVQPVRHQQRWLHYKRGTFNKTNSHLWQKLPNSFCRCAACVSGFLQEMMAIMTSIYDMMGRYTLPSVRDDSPFEHVEKFFQVCYLKQLLNLILRLILCIWINCLFKHPLHVWHLSENGSEPRWSGDYWWIHRNLPKGKLIIKRASATTRWLTEFIQLSLSRICLIFSAGWKYNGFHAALWECHLVSVEGRGAATLRSASSCNFLGLK